jgi:hypothetical protein
MPASPLRCHFIVRRICRFQTSPTSPAPTEITQFAGPDFYDLSNYNQSSWTPPPVAYRFQNDRTWNLKADVRRDIPHLRFPLELRAGANFYQLHRRRMASHNALTFVGPDGRPGSGDEQINASRFEKTTHGDRYLYLNRKPPILDNYKVAEYMREFPLAFQDTHRYSLELNVGNVFDVPSRETLRGGYLQESRSYGTTYALSFSANLADLKLPLIDRR